MLRIEILFDRQTAKAMKPGTLESLRAEVERRFSPRYPEIWLRIDTSSETSLTVSGTDNEGEKAAVIEMLEDIWQDDAWIPAA